MRASPAARKFGKFSQDDNRPEADSRSLPPASSRCRPYGILDCWVAARCRRSYRVIPEHSTGSGGYPAGQIDSLRGGDCRNMRVELREGEGFDQLFRRFTKGIERSGVIREHRRGLRFISVQEENRAKRRKAERRRRRNATT